MLLKLDWHTRLSFLKSALRIVGFVGLLISIPYGVTVLVGAEIIGILEEIIK